MKSAEYWAQRAVDLKLTSEAEAEALTDELRYAYNEAIRQVTADLTRWWTRFQNNNGEVSFADAQRLLNSRELAEFRATLDEYIAMAAANGDGRFERELENISDRVHIKRLEALLVSMEAAASEVLGQPMEEAAKAIADSYTEAYTRGMYEIQKGAGVGWSFSTPDPYKLERVTKEDWAAAGSSWSSSIWDNKAALVSTIRQTLTTGILTGDGLNKAIDNVSKRFDVSYSSAARLIQTEHAKVASDAQKALYKDLGVSEVELVCTLDSVTCPKCGALDGTVIKETEMRAGVTVPPFHPRCRCTTAPYYEDMVGVGERAARDGDGETYYVPEDMTYRQWKQLFVDNDDGSGIIKRQSYYAGLKDKVTEFKQKRQERKERYDQVSDDYLRSLPTHGPETLEESLKRTNPNDYPGNCQRSVPAWELRMRGYDVTAADAPEGDTLGFGDFRKVFIGDNDWPKCLSNDSKAELIKAVESAPVGARFEIAATINDCRHCFAAINDHGNCRFVDPMYADDNAEYYFKERIEEVSYVRIDDKEISNLIKTCIEVPDDD